VLSNLVPASSGCYIRYFEWSNGTITRYFMISAVAWTIHISYAIFPLIYCFNMSAVVNKFPLILQSFVFTCSLKVNYIAIFFYEIHGLIVAKNSQRIKCILCQKKKNEVYPVGIMCSVWSSM
jgi:hypothetical protein